MRCCSNLLDGSAVIFTAFNQSINLCWHPKASKTTVGILWKVSLNILHAPNNIVLYGITAQVAAKRSTTWGEWMLLHATLRRTLTKWQASKPWSSNLSQQQNVKENLFLFVSVQSFFYWLRTSQEATLRLWSVCQSSIIQQLGSLIWGWVVKTCVVVSEVEEHKLDSKETKEAAWQLFVSFFK